MTGRALVVFHQAYSPQAGTVGQQPVETPGVRAPEPVDRLVGVPDHEQAFAPPAPCADQVVLNPVDVLKFIHQQIGERVGLSLGFPGGCLKLLLLQQKVVEIQTARPL